MSESAPSFARLQARLRSCTPPQDHLLDGWSDLSDSARLDLARQLDAFDLDAIVRLATAGQTSESGGAESWEARAARATEPPAVRLRDQQDEVRRTAARQAGEATLRAGEVGVLIVAGGQGTRLRFEAPKALFPIGPVSGRTLMQVLVDRTLATARRYGAPLPVYVMTSAATHDATLDYFRTHDRCGLAEDELRVFCQGDMPAVEASTGRLLLDGPGRLALSPDGHGGMLAAFDRSGLLDEAWRRGVRRLFYCQIDNPLVQLADPELLGWHLLEGAEATTQVVTKRDPLERVGNVVRLDGRVQVIEYSDLPEAAARRTRPDGGLELWAGNLAVHIFELDFLRRSASDAQSLPFHRALKPVPWWSSAGGRTVPERPNAIKLERFIFDLLPAARKALVVEGTAAEAFAPVKNHDAEGGDTPSAARAAMIAQAARWLLAAGARVEPGTPVEIHPRFALDARALAERLEPGLVVDRPTYFA